MMEGGRRSLYWVKLSKGHSCLCKLRVRCMGKYLWTMRLDKKLHPSLTFNIQSIMNSLISSLILQFSNLLKF